MPCMPPPTSIIKHTFKIKNGVQSSVANEMTKSITQFIREIVNDAKANIETNGNIRTGLLKKAIAGDVDIKKSEKHMEGDTLKLDLNIYAKIGIDRNIEGTYRGKPVKPYKYAHLVEFGHKAGDNPKKSEAKEKPFMRPAIAKVGSGTEFVRRLESAFLKGVEAAKTTEAKK